MTEIRIHPSLKMTFNPEVWNGKRMPYTNCYTYALDAQDLSSLDPGGLKSAGITIPPKGFLWSPQNFKESLQRDGLLAVAKRVFYPHREHIIVALGATIGSIYVGDEPLLTHNISHVMRIDGDGTLSEKGVMIEANNRTTTNGPLTIDNHLDHFVQRLELGVQVNNQSSPFEKRLIDAYSVGFFRVPEYGLPFRVQP